MPSRGQGAFEYILLLAGVLLVVVLAIVILRGGVLSTANNQIGASLNTYASASDACRAISSLVIHPNGTNATLVLCQSVDSSGTVVSLYSSPIVFNGATDSSGNMTFSLNEFGNTRIFLNIVAKNGTPLGMSETHCVDVAVGGAALLQNLCGTVGETTGGPGPTPTPAPTVELNQPANGGTAFEGSITFNFTPSSPTVFANATLYGNFSGTWGSGGLNTTALVNGSVNSIASAALVPGWYEWNVQVCDRIGRCSFAASNFTLNVSARVPGGTLLYQFNGTTSEDVLGWSVAVGDVNRDGFEDVAAGAVLGDAVGVDDAYVRVFSGSDGAWLYQFNGTAGGEWLGQSVAVGDVNGDGWPDIVASANVGDTPPFTDNGYVQVFSGSNGTLLYQFNGTADSDYFGQSLAVGDVNGDGRGEVIVGATQDGWGKGYVRVFNGSNGVLLYQFNGTEDFDYLGTSVAAGDVNGDGLGDVIVGAAAGNVSGVIVGYVRVFNGSNGALLYQFNGSLVADQLGRSVAVGDVNGDGKTEVVAGAQAGDTPGLSDNGYARVFSGSNGVLLYQFNGTADTDNLGGSVAVGDVNGDGLGDVIVGAVNGDVLGTRTGYVQVFNGSNGVLLYQFNGTDLEDQLGMSVAVGDVNRDARLDIIAGAPTGDVGILNEGYVRVYAGG